ncbi:MAG: xanthine dehydrogenase family protein subunit M [Polyangia bacterium]|jgi:carbon-monoxide dehydrogenase medium subunit|nr:xanthine dehydrogenase family protein subunit M [Polyangia bacterium]
MRTPRYFRPQKVEEAVAALSSDGKGAYVLAGGTDVVVKMRSGAIHPTLLVDIGRLGLGGIHTAQDAVLLGATCTMAEIRRHPLLMAEFPLLTQAASRLGANQIQHMATIGGNLCNASPAADGACALLALGAKVMIRSPRGLRSMTLEEFLVGPGKTALEPGELVQTVSIPRLRPQGRVVQSFHKMGGRNALVCSLAAVAGFTVLEGERVVESRLSLGAVGPTVLRAARAESLLKNERLSPELARTAAAAAAAEAQPITDHRATGDYRQRLVSALVRSHLQECLPNV